MTESKKWYVAYTKLGHERKVTEILLRQRIEHFCPHNTIHQPWNDHAVRSCLFKSYVFTRILEDELAKLYHTDGVINVVYRLGQPAVISDGEIESIRHFVSQYNNIKLERLRLDLKNGQPLTVPLLHNGNGVMSDDHKKRGRLVLSELGYILFGEEKMVVDEMPEHTTGDHEQYSSHHYPGETIIHNAGEMMKLLRVKFFHQ